jgi:hypothetical protein
MRNRKFLYAHDVCIGSESHPSSYPMIQEALSSGIKWLDFVADCLPPFSDTVKNMHTLTLSFDIWV